MDLDFVFTPGICTPLPPTTFNNLNKGEERSTKNSIVLHEQEDKENSPRILPVSERLTESPNLLGGHPILWEDGFKMCRSLL